MVSKANQTPEPNDDNRILDGVETGEELSPALAALYDELGISDGAARSKVFIYLQNAEGEFERVCECKPEEYNLMQTARKFGSGAYKVTLYGPNNTGRGSVRGSELFRIRFDPDEEARIRAKHAAPVATTQAMQQPQLSIADIVAALPRPPDMIETIIRLVPVITPMIAALKSPPAVAAVAPVEKSAIDKLTETLTLATISNQLRDVLGANGGDGGDSDLVTTGLRLVENFRDMSQGKSTDPVKQVLQGNQQQQRAQAVPINQSLSELENEEMNIQLAAIRIAARMNKDVNATAEKIIADAPAMIINAMCADDWLTGLRVVIPDCDAQIAWYTAVRERIVVLTKQKGKGKNTRK